MKGAARAQVLRHGVFAVAVGVVGAAASVVLCLVVGWAYDLVCAHGWLLYLLRIFAVARLLLYRALKLPTPFAPAMWRGEVARQLGTLELRPKKARTYQNSRPSGPR